MLDFLKELVAGLKSSAAQRLDHPLAVSFIIALLAVNWRVLAVLFGSDASVEMRIIYIDMVYANPWNYLWLPLIVALVYAFLLPVLTVPIAYVTYHSKRLALGYQVDTINSEIDRNRALKEADAVRPRSPAEEALMQKLEVRKAVVKNLMEKIAKSPGSSELESLKERADKEGVQIQILQEELERLRNAW